MIIEGINWTNLGSKVATGIYGMFYKINWNELGNLIGNKFMILWNFLYGLVSNLPWSRIGTSIGNAINGAIEKINPTTIGAAISDFAIGLLDAFINAVSAVNWTKVGQKIADLLKSINWSGLASKLFKAGLALMEGLLKAFNQLPGPVKAAGVAIAAFFAVLKGMSAINTMGNTIKRLISSGKDLKDIVSVSGMPPFFTLLINSTILFENALYTLDIRSFFSRVTVIILSLFII